MRFTTIYRSLLLSATLASMGCSAHGPAPAPPGPSAAPYRILDSGTGAPSSLESLAMSSAAAEVVFFGEFHDDPGTHHLELALFEAMAREDTEVVLALEMFERDVQPVLDSYLAGQISEQEFLASSRPWPNYQTDYRPLLELARERGIPVLATNVPRRLAAQVARGGLDTLAALPAAERSLVASEIECPRDDYFDRFSTTMRGHPGLGEEMIVRFYEAQCIKDETMAESISRVLEARPQAVVLHLNGSFHSDYHGGIPPRLLRRRPGTRVLTLTGVPVPDLAPESLEREPGRADFLLFTRRPPVDPGP